MEKIDAVILWVDGDDTTWRQQMLKYANKGMDCSANHFRDWGLLKYWFRSIEKNASWINKIHFVTWGHIPEWLDDSNPRINIVKHEDFMPKEFLPTFNSNAIEINLYRIKGLSEKFILFNDDVFLINKTSQEDFFRKGKPMDVLIEAPVIPEENIFYKTLFNNLAVINKHYNKSQIVKRKGYYSLRYGKFAFSSWIESHHRGFVGFMNPHITTPFLKAAFKKLWEMEPEKCVETSSSRFRSESNITQYLVRYIQLLDNNFLPRRMNFGKSIELHDGVNYERILGGKEKVICLNDSDLNMNFNMEKKRLSSQLQKLFPDKSQYERNI